MRKLLFRWLILATVFVLWYPAAALGSTAKTGPPTGTNMPGGEGMGIESLLYLRDGYCWISSPEAGKVTIYGKTSASQAVERILLRLTLQKWNGSAWGDLASWQFEDFYVSSVSGSKTVQVSSGYYYRVKGFHQVMENGTSESANSFSGYILVD
ncbi:MAG: DUF6147 family protein [Desulfotomaculales bacterium]